MKIQRVSFQNYIPVALRQAVKVYAARAGIRMYRLFEEALTEYLLKRGVDWHATEEVPGEVSDE